MIGTRPSACAPDPLPRRAHAIDPDAQVWAC